jgi:hypothetical protein
MPDIQIFHDLLNKMSRHPGRVEFLASEIKRNNARWEAGDPGDLTDEGEVFVLANLIAWINDKDSENGSGYDL